MELQASRKHSGVDGGLGGSTDSSSRRSSSTKPGSRLRAFRGDSARMSAVGSGGAAGLQRSSKQQAIDEHGGGSGPDSPASSDDEFVVFSAADLEAAEHTHPPDSQPPEAPWYRQRACITTLVGYGEPARLAACSASHAGPCITAVSLCCRLSCIHQGTPSWPHLYECCLLANEPPPLAWLLGNLHES